jgi:hypothetical protein
VDLLRLNTHGSYQILYIGEDKITESDLFIHESHIKDIWEMGVTVYFHETTTKFLKFELDES